MASLIILNFPSGSTFGINGHTWFTGQRFCGFSGLPNGIHWVYYEPSSSADSKSSDATLQNIFQTVSFGFFIQVDVSSVLLFKYNYDKEMLLPIDTTALTTFHTVEPWLIPFPITQDAMKNSVAASNGINAPHTITNKAHIPPFTALLVPGELPFAQLMNWITGSLLNQVLPSTWHVTSTMSSYLDDALLNLPSVETEPNLMLLHIHLKRTWRQGAVGREITEGFLDKSWELERLIQQVCLGDIGRFLGEFQLCYIIFLFTSNGSCFEQWKRMLVLVSSSYKAMTVLPDLYIQWIDVLKTQLLYCPDEIYRDILQEHHHLTKCLRNLYRYLSDVEIESEAINDIKKAFSKLSNVLKEKFHLNLDACSKTRLNHSMSLIYDSGNDELIEIDENDSLEEDSDDEPVIVRL